MKNSTEYAKQISDFIYNKPEIVAVLLTKYGYVISTENKKLIDIITELNKDVFELLYNDNQKFADDLASSMLSEGYVYASGSGVVGAVASLGSALIGAFTASSQAQKQRELQANVTNATLSSNEKLGYQTIQTQAETDRINNITTNVSAYRASLNVESTKRLNNTWTYILALGISFGLFYALSKIGKNE
jgi:hypothetical protein